MSKMKKFMLVLMVALVGGISKSVAQNTLVATLTHGDNIKMFYGVDAFVKAHAAAVDGDVINLSGGKFNSTTITKGITIRGTGTLVANPTYIINSIDINVPTTATERLNIEGCIFTGDVYQKGTLKNAYFLKNYFQNHYYIKGPMKDVMFVNCYMMNSVQYDNISSICTIQFVNSYIFYFYLLSNYANVATSNSFINCVIVPCSGYQACYMNNSQLVNCILYYTSNTTYYNYDMLPATSSAWNCVAVGAGAQNVFNNLSSPQNCTYANKDIFIDSNYMKDLTNEAKAKYLGNDGTPVGVFGGVFPYNMTPTYPTITKMNVANRTTADGKLSVEIEVSAAE